MPEMEKTYDPKREPEIYKKWEESGFFNPDTVVSHKSSVKSKNAKRFSMVLPPPNVTGVLHLGHAFEDTVQDILVRYHRMQGEKTLWIPGTDHAAIATQEKVEKEIYKREGKSRHDLGREEFLQRVEQFAKESHDTIVRQVRAMGASLDWSREAFTLDAKRSMAVREAFKRMYDAQLIYRGGRIVNWDPKLQTTVSDEEIEWREEKAQFYYFTYGPFEIGTARPETKFGDKYVVMHPKDKRYAKWRHGEQFTAEWINGPITATVIKDEAVDMDFGTGVMTITPWHDAIDFEIAERHNLHKEQIIDLRGKLLPIAGEFAGKKITEARPLVVEKLKAKGLLVKVDESYTHRIATSSRGGGTIEPQILTQWFIDVHKKFKLTHSKLTGIRSGSMITLKEIMQKTVKSGQIDIVPERFKKIYFHWIDNLRDWCISRQIWYGHRIPVWYKGDEIFVGSEKPGEDWEQDPDTLDTWFSSGLWTFSTLGWPEETKDLKAFHPTSVIAPGYEILFFWVARMILMSGALLGEIPFRTVFLHGIVRDKQGRKFSKSLGNGIDPLVLIEKYGADALRMSLVIGAAPGNDVKFNEDQVRGYRNFATKIWNMARFIQMNDKQQTIDNRRSNKREIQVTAKDKKILKNFADIKKKVEKSIETFKFHEAAETLYHYIWHEVADKIIEHEKPRLQGDDESEAAASHAMLSELFLGCITALHPFMPYVTEAVYQELYAKGENDFLMVRPW